VDIISSKRSANFIIRFNIYQKSEEEIWEDVDNNIKPKVVVIA
jgi:hypothetical protein